MPLPVPDISRNLFDLRGYIVTGAGQGIGLVLAEALAYAGSDLVPTERNAGHFKVGAISAVEAPTNSLRTGLTFWVAEAGVVSRPRNRPIRTGADSRDHGHRDPHG
jgi:NAD(P)-dependent dehydrogenase (short-subunit alcohol dehydrogenase family)